MTNKTIVTSLEPGNRIELPADQLFNLGTAQLKMGADETIRSVGADLLRNYPQQMIGVEGYTDNTSFSSAQMPTSLGCARCLSPSSAVRTAG